MVKAGSTLLAIIPAMLLASQGFASAVPVYRMGEVATNDVITTTRLVVVDDQATADIRHRESRKIAPFIVYSTNHAASIESDVKLAITRMREEFLALLQARYGTDLLTKDVLGSESFNSLSTDFLSISAGPPVPKHALSLWAEGRAGEAFLDGWFAPLRQVMEVPIVPGHMPGGRVVPDRMKLRLTHVGDLSLFVKEAFALSNSVPSFGSNLVSLAAARNELRNSYPEKGSPAAAFMALQLQPNCRFDTNLTRRVRDFAVSGLVQMRHFEPGEVVIRTGQVIDEPALAALAAMRQQAWMVSLEKEVAVGKVDARLLSERNLWLAVLLGGTVVVLLIVLVRTHRRQRREMLPVLSSSFLHQGAEHEDIERPTVVDVPPAGEEQWRRRALEAEQHVVRAKALAQSNLMPHLAQQLKDNVVQQLSEQVDDMLAVQTAVANQMSTLEQRLERLHAPLQERLSAYEERILELEKELTQRGQENQVLLHARIKALRRQMELETAQAGAGVN